MRALLALHLCAPACKGPHPLHIYHRHHPPQQRQQVQPDGDRATLSQTSDLRHLNHSQHHGPQFATSHSHTRQHSRHHQSSISAATIVTTQLQLAHLQSPNFNFYRHHCNRPHSCSLLFSIQPRLLSPPCPSLTFPAGAHTILPKIRYYGLCPAAPWRPRENHDGGRA